MCIKVPGQPHKLTLQRYRAGNGKTIAVYTYALGKVTNLRNSEHISSRDFHYPIGQTVQDPNVKIGSHDFCLHFIANPASNQLDSYGSHRLVIIPGSQLWEPPVAEGEQPVRCWHSTGATSLFCLDCAGLTAEDLNNPEFWADLTKPRRRKTSRKPAESDEFVLRLPRDSVWHKQVALSRN